jgi:hypothetical protein
MAIPEGGAVLIKRLNSGGIWESQREDLNLLELFYYSQEVYTVFLTLPKLSR